MRKTILIAIVLCLFAAAPEVRHMQLTKSEGESEFPAMAFNGSEIGIAWMDGRDGNQEIYTATANLDAKTSSSARRITSSAEWDDNPELAWTGSEFGLVWVHERKSKFDLMFRTLDARASAKGSARRLLANKLIGKDTSVCWTGAGYGVVSSEFNGAGQADLVFRFLSA